MKKKATQRKTVSPKQKPVTRVLLTDRECHVFRRSLIEFGYPQVTFEQIRKIADEVAAGTYSATNVMAVIMCQQIDDAAQQLQGKPK